MLVTGRASLRFMSLCRITSIRPGIRYRAKNTSGAWRTLAEGDSLADGESLEVFANGPRFGETACVLQNRVSAAWANSELITLDLTLGTSHTRKDRLTVSGDTTDSTVSVATYDKGHRPLLDAHNAQIDGENSRGIMFEWQNRLWSGVLSDVTSDKTLQEGGFLEGSDAQLVAHRSQFAQEGMIPLTGQKLFAEEPFLIGSIRTSDVVVEFELRRNTNA